MKRNLKQMSEEELTLFIEGLGQKPYRAKQIIHWIYKRLATSLDEMTDLPNDLRKELKKTAFISSLNLLQKQVSNDGTYKFLFEMEDGETIESVLIPDRGRHTLCISSQVGCRMGCKFCMTGRLGLRRNLRSYEIVDQIISVKRLFRNEVNHVRSQLLLNGASHGAFSNGVNITNIVFMGMGEPLDNLDEVISALWRITNLMGFSRRRITLSTAGVIPRIPELFERGPDINLAISLNATTDEIRDKIMPINKKYPLQELLNICKKFPLPSKRRLTFEYVLLDGINDSGKDALRLVRLLKGIRTKVKVNLIPYNPIHKAKSSRHKLSEQFKRPSEDKILTFQKILLRGGVTAFIRQSRGEDISAACGQLTGEHPS